MTITLILHWFLWGTALLAGAGALAVLFKLRLVERALPAWNELKDIYTRLPQLREEQRQAGEAAASQRQELAKLESEVVPLRQLREWLDANPDAPARLQQLVADLEHTSAQLSALQQNGNRLRAENAQLTEDAVGLHKQVAVLEEQKKEITEQLPLLREEQRQVGEAAASVRQELAKLESEVASLRQLREGLAAQPDAPVAPRQSATDLEHANAELTAVQQNGNQLSEESAELTKQAVGLRKPVRSPKKQKAARAKGSAKAVSSPAKRQRKGRQPKKHSNGAKQG